MAATGPRARTGRETLLKTTEVGNVGSASADAEERFEQPHNKPLGREGAQSAAHLSPIFHRSSALPLVTLPLDRPKLHRFGTEASLRPINVEYGLTLHSASYTRLMLRSQQTPRVGTLWAGY
jgi:hypothetical protein